MWHTVAESKSEIEAVKPWMLKTGLQVHLARRTTAGGPALGPFLLTAAALAGDKIIIMNDLFPGIK